MESNLTLLVVHIFVKWGVGEFKPTTFAFRPPGHRETEASESGDALELSFFFFRWVRLIDLKRFLKNEAGSPVFHNGYVFI